MLKTGVLALILGGSRAIMKNYIPKSQEGFEGDARKTWSQSSSASFPWALDTNTICTGGIIKKLPWSSRNYLNKKASRNKTGTELKTNQLEGLISEGLISSHMHIPLLTSKKVLRVNGVSVWTVHTSRLMCIIWELVLRSSLANLINSEVQNAWHKK